MTAILRIHQRLVQHNLYSVLIVGLVCLSTFGITVTHDYNLDDNLVTQNHRLTSGGINAIAEIYESPYYEDDMGYSYGFRPTTLASFALEHAIFGESPTVSHTINVLLYLATCILVYLLIARLFPDKKGMALFGALLFTVHPLHTEVVASIKNRDEILALFFALLACYTLIRPMKWLIALPLAAAFFFLSLTSKMSAVNFILLLALVPTYPKPLLKDALLLTLYGASLYFVFKGRDMNFGIETKIAYITFAFLALRLFTLFHDTQVLHRCARYLRKGIQHVLQRARVGFRKITKAYMKYILATRVPVGRSIEILVSGLLLLWVVGSSITALEALAFVLVSLSFFVFKTNKYDAFFRYSFVFLISSDLNAYFSYVVLNNLLSVSNKRASFNYSILQQGLGVAMLLFFWLISMCDLDDLTIATVHLGVFVSLLIGRIPTPTFKKLAVVCSAPILILFHVYILGITVPESALVYTLLFTPLILRTFAPKNVKEQISKLLSGRNIGVLVSRYFQKKFSVLITITTALALLVGGLNFSNNYLDLDQRFELAQNFYHDNVQHIKSYAGFGSSYDVHEHWDPSEFQSWKRPFDFVEHPLSPMAPATWKYGTAFATLNRYLGKLFVPYPQAFYYGYNEVELAQLLSPQSLFSIAVHLGLLILAFAARKAHPAISIGVLLYLSSIVLFSGLVELVAGMFADRFSYVASFGFCLAFAGLVGWFIEKSPQQIRYIIASLMFVLLASFAAYSVHRNALWKDEITLMRHDIQHVPNSAQAHRLLGFALMKNVFSNSDIPETNRQQQIAEAASHFAKSTELVPEFFNAWVDLGRAYMANNEPEKAINAYKSALQIDSSYTLLYLNVASASEAIYNYNDAVYYYEKYMAANAFVGLEVYDALARNLYQLQRYDDAIYVCQQALNHDPSLTFFQEKITMLQRLKSEQLKD